MKLVKSNVARYTIFLVVQVAFFFSCTTGNREWDRRKLYPKIKKLGSHELYKEEIDTLSSGEIFEATMYTDIEEYLDSTGENIVLDKKIMKFKYSKGPTFNKRDYFLFPVFVENDIGRIHIPIDSILKHQGSGLFTWQAHVISIEDSLYIIEGLWYLVLKDY